MVLVSVVAANSTGGGDLIVGLLIGGCIGFLAGPLVRSWLTHREWEAASHEARIADQLLDRMELDTDRDGRRIDADDGTARTSWRTQR
jgi:hypothetical protein